MKILYRGAESIIYVKDNVIHKERLHKNYRIKELDQKIVVQRTRKEVNILKKLNELGIPSPKYVNYKNNTIKMEYLVGSTVKQLADKNENVENLFFDIGVVVRSLHNNDIIHGDLTTSNFIFTDKVYIIDFGLSYISNKVENKAVDLYVFEKSIQCAHDTKYIDIFYNGYNAHGNNKELLERLEVVRKRGRKQG